MRVLPPRFFFSACILVTFTGGNEEPAGSSFSSAFTFCVKTGVERKLKEQEIENGVRASRPLISRYPGVIKYRKLIRCSLRAIKASKMFIGIILACVYVVSIYTEVESTGAARVGMDPSVVLLRLIVPRSCERN